MYETELLQLVARDLDADFVTMKRRQRDPFQIGQVGVIQRTNSVNGSQTLGRFVYLGNGFWKSQGRSLASIKAMHFRLRAL